MNKKPTQKPLTDTSLDLNSRRLDLLEALTSTLTQKIAQLELNLSFYLDCFRQSQHQTAKAISIAQEWENKYYKTKGRLGSDQESRKDCTINPDTVLTRNVEITLTSICRELTWEEFTDIAFDVNTPNEIATELQAVLRKAGKEISERGVSPTRVAFFLDGDYRVSFEIR